MKEVYNQHAYMDMYVYVQLSVYQASSDAYADKVKTDR